MGLKDIGETLPPGFKFNPSDEELVCHYLYNKILNQELMKGTLIEVDLHTIEPWQLPEVAKLNENEWYFFSFRDRKYATGFRTNRATISGYWKATGKDRVILDPKTRRTVGMRKTLVFYQNRAPNGVKSPWIMHEFRLETPHMPPKEDWVLCRVFHKGKEEANGHHNNLDVFAATSSSPPPLFVNEYTMANTCGYQRSDSFTLNPPSRIQTLTNQNPTVDLDQPMSLNPSTHLLQFLKEGNPTTTYNMKESGHDQVHEADQYELLWDIGMDDDTILGHGQHHHQQNYNEFGDVGFEDGNGIVLL